MDMERDAVISHCEKYRYTLKRKWAEGPYLVWIMLNPSTADGRQDDATIRRIVAFSKKWGYGGLMVVNLFAYRATNPKELARVVDPVGPVNDAAIRSACGFRDVVLAWGELKDKIRVNRVLALLRDIPNLGSVSCLGRTRAGSPRHPVRLPASTERQPYSLS